MRSILTEKALSQMKDKLSTEILANNVDAGKANAVLDKNMPKADNYQSRLLKLIPSEVIAVYIFINGIIGNDTSNKYLVLKWVVFGVLFVINPLYIRYATNVTNWKQILITALGFAVWAFSLGNNYMVIGGDTDFSLMLGSVVLALYTLIVPIFLKESK
jgi:hypothetical protein